MTRVFIIVPDARPLISLARAERLDLLTILGLPVYIVDQVYFEATQNKAKPDTGAIEEFVERNRHLVHLPDTATGENARYVREAGLSGRRQSGLGEAAISEFLSDFESRFENAAPLLIFEDSDIMRGRMVIPGNVHVISTKTFVYGLALRGYLKDAAEVWQSIRSAGRSPSEKDFERPGALPLGKTTW